MPASGRTRGWVVAGLVVVVAAGAVTWHKRIRHELFPKNFGVVEEGAIFRSGRLTPRMLRAVTRDRGLRTIIDLDSCGDSGAEEERIAGELGVTYRGFCLSGDGRGRAQDVADVVRLMADPDRQPMLVHCAAGAQRTTSVVLAYERLVNGRSIQDMYAESFEYGHEPDEWILLAFLADNMTEIESAFRETETAHVPAGVPAGEAAGDRP